MKTIPIDDIKSLKDIERFFTLLVEAGVLYHPEVSFRDFIHRDENGNESPSFSKTESKRLDMLMKKCRDLADERDTDLYKICTRVDNKIKGRNTLKRMKEILRSASRQ